jgi:flagellar biosynthesis/type III secretory pathway protein FliH
LSDHLQELLILSKVDIDDSEERFGHLNKAASDIADYLRANPNETIAHVLVALNPETPEDDPVFDHAEQAVTEQWKLLRKRYQDRPRELLRPVVLAAIDRASSDNIGVFTAAALTASSILYHVGTHRDDGTVTRIVEGWAAAVEETAVKSWQTRLLLPEPPKPEAAPTTGLQVSQFSAEGFLPSIDMPAAPNFQSFPGWATAFSPKISVALAATANSVTAEIAKAYTRAVEQQFQAVANAMTKYAEFAQNVAKATEEGQRAALLRLDLLWWKEALYSPSAKKSYRAIPAPGVALLMAEDILARIRIPAPQSVVAYLREAIAAVQNDARSAKSSLADWLQRLHPGTPVSAIVAPPEARKGRVSLGYVLRKALHAKVSVEELRISTGLDPTLEISLADLGAWYFCDRQAEQAVAEDGNGG